MQIQINKAEYDSAVARLVANGAKSISKEDLSKVAVVNFDENMWEIGDTFTMPDSLENAIFEEVFENLPKSRRTGEYPKGYFCLVWVENATTGFKGVKKFRPNQADAVQPEYAFDAANQSYKATGARKGATAANSTVAAAVAGCGNLYDKLEKLVGKTIKVTSKVSVDVAIREGGSRVVTGIQSRELPIFNFEN